MIHEVTCVWIYVNLLVVVTTRWFSPGSTQVFSCLVDMIIPPQTSVNPLVDVIRQYQLVILTLQSASPLGWFKNRSRVFMKPASSVCDLHVCLSQRLYDVQTSINAENCRCQFEQIIFFNFRSNFWNYTEIWQKIGQKMKKIKNLINGTLKLNILQPWSEIWQKIGQKMPKKWKK